MKYAIIKLAGRQYKVSVGDTLSVDKLDLEPGKKLTVKEVLLVADGEKVDVGTPTVSTEVTLEAVEQKKDKKIRVATYKAKSRYRRVKGHRQQITVVKVVSIGKKAKVSPKPVSPKGGTTKKAPSKTK